MLHQQIIVLARQLVGRARYEYLARLEDAPRVVNCMTLIEWAFGRYGVVFPKRRIEWWVELGTAVAVSDLIACDLVFTKGPRNFPVQGIPGGIGHVGLVTEAHTVIHATNYVGVEEVFMHEFLRKRRICHARRIV